MNDLKVYKSLATDDDMTKINQYTRKELTKDDVYIFNVTLCDNDIDRDFERFSVEALNQMSKLFIGKTGISDHSFKSSDQKARIFDTWVEVVDGEFTKNDEPLYQLKAKAYMLNNEDNKSLIDEIDAGIKKEVSVSCSLSKRVCSICGTDTRKGYCEHVAGKSYDEKLCFHTLEDATDAYEFSFVAVPAQRNAGITKSFKDLKVPNKTLEEKIAAGRQYRSCTLKALNDENGESIVEGYATVFEQPYYLFSQGNYDFYEVVSKNALNEADLSDVIMQYDHTGRVFARIRNNTLECQVDSVGLKIKANLGGTELGKAIYNEIKGKYTDQMSYSYVATRKTETYSEDIETGRTKVLIRVEKISKVYDVSAVSIPANDATVISARHSLDGLIERIEQEQLEARNAKAQELEKLKLNLKIWGFNQNDI